MRIRLLLKGVAEKLPAAVGRPLSWVPFSLRLGAGYPVTARSIRNEERSTSVEIESRQLSRLLRVLNEAYERVEFYRGFYRSKGFHPEQVRTLADWQRVPIVTKADMQGVPLGSRTARGARGQKINTGGTSGEPLEFLVDHDAFAREWAHMHHLWKARGYRPWHVKLTLRGKHFDRTEKLRYNAVHNEYVANANCPMSEVADAVLALPQRVMVRWVHGYPSLVAEFAHALESRPAGEVAGFRARLFGALLGSEFPAEFYRSAIERILTCNVVSWYGHSEMSILAGETATGIYEAMSTYGYAEAVELADGVGARLVGTSLHNLVHPFVRYDTGDVVEALTGRPCSLAFRVGEGRIGEFVCDRHGNKHALTAVIFGRHHPAFERIKHVQVRDEGGGCVSLLVTPRSGDVDVESILAGFHLEGLDIEWRMQIVEAPVRTSHGKIRLKVS